MKYFRIPILVFCLSIITITLVACGDANAEINQIDPELEAQVLEILRQNPQVILDSVNNYRAEQEQKEQEARAAAMETLKTDSTQFIGSSPTTSPTIENKIILMEFSDFQCPFCAEAHTTVKEFMAKYGDRVVLVYKHLPLEQIHPEAMPAAQASWAAQQQGKFWEYHDALFENQNKLGEDLYLSIAKDLGLNIDKFNQDRAQAIPAIDEDIALADKLNFRGTPQFAMNGEVFSGAVSLKYFEDVLAKVSN
jgi:protein-disulfide isomerase